MGEQHLDSAAIALDSIVEAPSTPARVQPEPRGPVRAEIFYIDPAKGFGFARSRGLKGRIYIPPPMVAGLASCERGTALELTLRRSGKGWHAVQVGIVESLPEPSTREILLHWSEKAQWRSLAALPRLLSRLRSDREAIRTLLAAVTPTEWASVTEQSWTEFWRAAGKTRMSEALAGILEGYASAGCPTGKNNELLLGAAKHIASLRRGDLLLRLSESCLAAHPMLDPKATAEMVLIAGSFGAVKAFQLLIARSERDWEATPDIWSDLVLAAARTGASAQFETLLERGDRIGWPLPRERWSRVISYVVYRHDAACFSSLVRLFVRLRPDVRPDAWARFAMRAASFQQNEQLAAVIAICEEKGWPLDGPSWGGMVKATGIGSNVHLFDAVLSACERADWPISAEAWVSFATAAGRLGSNAGLVRVAKAAIARQTSLNSAAWAALMRNALELNDLGCLDRIVSSWGSVGRPIDGPGWSVVAQAADLLGRPNVLASALAAHGAQLALLADEEARDLLRALDDPFSVVYRSVETSGPALSRILEHLWGARLNHREPISSEFLLPFIRVAGRIGDSAAINACAAAWPIAIKEGGAAKADVAVALAVACLSINITTGMDDARLILENTSLAEGASGSGKIALALQLLDARSDRRGQNGGDAPPSLVASDVYLAELSLDERRLYAFMERLDAFIREQPIEDAIRELEKLRTFTRTARDGRDDKLALAMLARAHRTARGFSRAIELFRLAAEAGADAKNQSVCAYEIGVTYLAMGRPADALASFERAIRFDQQPRASTLTKAATAAALCGEFSKAVAWLEILTARDPSMKDERAWGQLARTMLTGAERLEFPAEALDRAAKIACDLIVLSEGDRIQREAAMIAIDATRHPLSTFRTDFARSTAGRLLAESPRAEIVGSICDAIVQGELWIDGVIDVLIARLTSEWPNRDLVRPIVRCLSAAMASAYHSGRLGAATYKHGITELFSRLVEARVPSVPDLAFEFFAARRGYVLRRILSDYARIAEMGVNQFLLAASQSSYHPLTSGVLDKLSRLVQDQMPKGVEPRGYGGTDAIELWPRLEKYLERLRARAMGKLRPANVLNQVTGPRVMVRHLEWMAIRSAIGTLIPSSPDSPFARVGHVSVPWHLDVHYQRDALMLRFSFPSNIHQSHDPDRLLRSARKALKRWVYEEGRALSVKQAQLQKWLDMRVVEIEFSLKEPVSSWCTEAMIGFTEFLAHESRRILEGGEPSQWFFEEARTHFSGNLAHLVSFGKNEMAALHQKLMDEQFAVTSDWLFLAENVEDRPEYHPRYEVHALKGLVSLAGRELHECGSIDEGTISKLRARLLVMRRNILETLKRAVGRASEANDEALTDIVAVIRHAVDQVLGGANLKDHGDIDTAIIAPPSLLARVDHFSLHSAMFNLLVNAAEAMTSPETERRITITVETREGEDGERAVITVSNPFNHSEAPKRHSTGVGQMDTRFHIEELNGGTVSSGPGPSGDWVARLELRK